MTSVTDLIPDSCFDELNEWAGNDEVKAGVIQLLKQVKDMCVCRAKEIEEENKELKEDLQHTKDCSWDYYTELLKLRKENKKLKRRIEEDHKAVPSFLIKDLYLDATEENKELKEENQRHKWNIKRLKVDNEIFTELVASIKKETDKAK